MPSPGSGPSTLPLLPRGAEPRVHSRTDPAAEWPLCPEARAERLLSPPIPSASPRTELLLLVLSGPGTPKEEATQWGTPGATGHPDSELQAGKRRGSGRPPRCRTGAWGRGAFAEVEGTSSSSRAGGSRQGTELRGREAGSGWRSHRLWDAVGGGTGGGGRMYGPVTRPTCLQENDVTRVSGTNIYLALAPGQSIRVLSHAWPTATQTVAARGQCVGRSPPGPGASSETHPSLELTGRPAPQG